MKQQKIPTIEEIRGRTVGSVVREHGYGVTALFEGDGAVSSDALAREVSEHTIEQGEHVTLVDRVSFPTAGEERSLRLAVKHIAAALGVPQDDLRSIHLTPHVLTASAVSPDGLRTFVDGRVLR